MNHEIESLVDAAVSTGVKLVPYLGQPTGNKFCALSAAWYMHSGLTVEWAIAAQKLGLDMDDRVKFINGFDLGMSTTALGKLGRKLRIRHTVCYVAKDNLGRYYTHDATYSGDIRKARLFEDTNDLRNPGKFVRIRHAVR